MGAGRRTQTFIGTAGAGPSGGAFPDAPPQRNLDKSELGGVIFGCTNATINECLTKKLFGLPTPHIKYVQHVRPGTTLFLFNYVGRVLHGIYEATGDGALNIDPVAWADSRGFSGFPAQVKVKIRQSCSPLPESVFKECILDNYFSESKFTFELTFSQKDSLVSRFTKNMQGPSKPISSNTVLYDKKPGGPGAAKGLKIGGESDNTKAWKKAPRVFAPTLGNAWQKGGTGDAGKGSADDVKSISFHHPGEAKQKVSEESSEIVHGSLNLSPFDINSSRVPSEKVFQQEHFPALGPATGTPGTSSDVKKNEPSNVYHPSMEVPVKSARQREVLGKLQMLNAARAEDPLQRPDAAIVEFQGQKISSGTDAHQQPSLQGGYQYNSQNGVDSSRERVIALTHARPPPAADWERQAEEEAINLQSMLRDDRERPWVTSSPMDVKAATATATATALNRTSEVPATTVAQMQQESIEVHWPLVIELRARTEQQLQQQKALEKLQSTNAMLESSLMETTSELAKMRLEMRELKSQIGTAYSRGQQVAGLQNLYIIGGLADSWLDTVIAYSPKSRECKPVAPLNRSRAYAASSICHGYIYVYGGGNGASWSDKVERYNTISDVWEECRPMASERGSLGGVTVHGKIYALGGGRGTISFDDTECYDPILGTWTPSTNLIERRFLVAAAELNGAIYAIGGFNGREYLSTAERFDPREGLWTSIPSMSVQRGALTAACLNGNLYALGGFDGHSKCLNSVEIYDPRANMWRPGPPMNTPRTHGASVTFGNVIYSLGGIEFMDSSSPSDTMKMEVFSEATGWKSIAMDQLKNRKFVAAAVV